MQTIDRAQSFYKLLEEGYSVRDIASIEELSRQAVHQILQKSYTSKQIAEVVSNCKLQNELRILAEYDPTKTLSQNSRDLGVPKSSLHEILKRHNGLTDNKEVSQQAIIQRKKDELEGQSFNHWKIVEVLGYRASDGSISLNSRNGVLAGNVLCGKCGEVKCLSLRNILSGRSRMCQSCGFKHRKKKGKVLTN